MRRMLLGLAVLSLFVLAKSASAACASGYQYVPIYCQATGGCSGSTTLEVPYGVGGLYLQARQVTCCGAQNTTYYYAGPCWYTRVDNPEIRKRLHNLATNGSFVFATCTEDYLPLGSVFVEEKDVISLTLKPTRPLQ